MKLAGLSANYDLLKSNTNTRSKASEERQAKRLGEMQDAIKRLQEMPSPKEIAKQNSRSRVDMLKQQLEAMRKMLMYASPEMARILARELKSIAKELSSIAKSMEGGSQSAVAIPTSPEIATGAAKESGNISAETQSAASFAANAEQAASHEKEVNQADPAQAKLAVNAATPMLNNPAEGKTAGQNTGDGDLRAVLQGAKQLLKEIARMLKGKMALAANEAKMSKEEKQAKDDLQSIEKSLAEMDKALSQGGNTLYSALGELGLAGMGEGFSASVSVSGLNINITT